jgi:cyanate permease
MCARAVSDERHQKSGLHDATNSWTIALNVLIGIAVLQVATGFASGRARTVATTAQ